MTDLRDPFVEFGRVIRDARATRAWTQDQLAEAAGVARITVARYEGGKVTHPRPDESRRIFQALRLDPRRIPVLLGYITAEELELPETRRFDPDVEEVIAIFEDPTIDASKKAEWVEFLRFRTRLGTAGGLSGTP